MLKKKNQSLAYQILNGPCGNLNIHGAIQPSMLLLLDDTYDFNLSLQIRSAPQLQNPGADIPPQLIKHRVAADQAAGVQDHRSVHLLRRPSPDPRIVNVRLTNGQTPVLEHDHTGVVLVASEIPVLDREPSVHDEVERGVCRVSDFEGRERGGFESEPGSFVARGDYQVDDYGYG